MNPSPSVKDLPYLVKLIDDESLVVREAVFKHLRPFGLGLEKEISDLALTLNASQKKALKHFLSLERGRVLKSSWYQWQQASGENQKLEKAFVLLEDYFGFSKESLGVQLDRLADLFFSSNTQRDSFTLANFLFKTMGLGGAKTDYYNPNHSSLIYTIEQKKGSPISLACIYILVGHRLGLQIEGCNFPGHFLARVRTHSGVMLVDCYNGGELIEEEFLKNLNSDIPEAISEVLSQKVDAKTIIARVLGNLSNAYARKKDKERKVFFEELLGALEGDSQFFV